MLTTKKGNVLSLLLLTKAPVPPLLLIYFQGSACQILSFIAMIINRDKG